jgi:peptidoglycan hydrolase CwlO-like protein
MKKSILRLISLFMIFSFVASQTAFADEAQLMDMLKQMQKQMTELQSTVAMQKAEIQALKTKGPSIQMAQERGRFYQTVRQEPQRQDRRI